MSIEQKQTYLKEAIIGRGINPEEFFEFWQTLDEELDDVSMERLMEIVDKFIEQQPQDEKLVNQEGEMVHQAHQDEEDQFDQFQTAEEADVKEAKDVKNDYADFNWDFLNIKKQNLEKLAQTSVASSSNTSPNKIIDLEEKVEQKLLSFSPATKEDSKVRSKQTSKKIEKDRMPIKPKIVKPSSNLIEQIDQKQQRFIHRLPQTGNPADQKSITVKQVLKSSTLGKLKCLKLQQNILSHHTNVEIFLTNFQQVEEKGGNIINKLIKTTQILFTIKTVARNKNRSIGISWEVKRKPSEFQWLRNTLIRFYPGLVVPPLPSQPKSKQKMFGYQKKLEHFLIDCYRCPELKNSKHYQIFLSYANQSDFDSYIKNSLTSSKPKTLGHIINMTGTIDTLYSNNIEQYGTGLQSYLTKTSNHLKHVNQILNDINQAYDTISQSYRELQNVFMEMSDESHGFSNQKCYNRLADAYKQIAILTGEHSTFCEGEKDFIDAFMKSHFSYQKLRLQNMQNLITKRTNFACELGKRSKDEQGKSMFGKISSLFGEKSEYVDSPSSSYQILYNQVGYYNNQLLQESVRCIEGMIESHINHFSGYGHSRIDNVDKMQKIWSNQLVQLSKLGLVK